MTTISGEFLRLLREDPEFRAEVRREVLGQELIELPERFTAFVERVEAFMERTEAFMERTEAFMEQTRQFVERTEAFMERTEAFMEQTQEKFSEVNSRLDRIETTVESLSGTVEGLSGTVEGLSGTVEGLSGTVEGLSGTVEGLSGTVEGLSGTVGSLSGTVGRLDGREYERRVSRTLTGEVSRVLGLRRGRLVYSAAYGLHQSFQDQMEDELDAGRMTQSQWQELLNTDAIIRVVQGGKTVFAVSEISVTIHEDDIDRAVERAAIIQQATGLTTYPVVIGSRIPQPQVEQAESRNVATVTMQQQGE